MIEQKILAHLVSNETYARKVLPFVKPEYFSDHAYRVIYQTVTAYVERYNTIPSAEALTIDVDKIEGMSSDTFTKIVETIPNLKADKDTDLDWLLDQTEKYCQDRAVYNAIMDSIKIIDGKDDKRSKGALPEILSEALAVSFDTNIGHDFLTDADKRSTGTRRPLAKTLSFKS